MVSVTWLLLFLFVGLTVCAVGLAALAVIFWRYTDFVVRIFEEKPLFIIPRGLPQAGSEEVRLRTSDGLTLAGSYLHTSSAARRGVILFGTEYGSNRWSCGSYCRHLLADGFDVFTFEFRSQGQSDPQPGYEPLQWVTDYEVADMRAALTYLKKRPDADPHGVGIFGISRGGGAGIVAAASDPFVRCVATDGAFATRTTMIPYMRKWASIYLSQKWLAGYMPRWVFSMVATYALRKIMARRRCRFPSLERAISRLSPRPLLMIHGGEDTYIKPPIAQALFEYAREPKEFWLVEGAKHNQALHIAGEAYRQRVQEFFTKHLAGVPVLKPVEPLAQTA
jgi:pimeloyl-ACP methyl ester carboxylesterase